MSNLRLDSMGLVRTHDDSICDDVVAGELVYRRTYSRKKDDGTNERWHETVERVIACLRLKS